MRQVDSGPPSRAYPAEARRPGREPDDRARPAALPAAPDSVARTRWRYRAWLLRCGREVLVAERARELYPKAFASDSSQLWPDTPVSPRDGLPAGPPRPLDRDFGFRWRSARSGSPLGSALRYPPTPRRPAEGEGRAPGQPSPAAGFGESEVRRHRALEFCTSSSSESSRKDT
ncbi:hypothetical protein J1605_010110 [Eschrichtius robustus]|uniref:Uncharacterized protein n=1 Tax=Eschrichtius robustus TaxID=9764 RepID=A0AB34GPD6_ESCRO|nr:hypothetical protein J1605_010110 [Eschrichtius robustus]